MSCRKKKTQEYRTNVVIVSEDSQEMHRSLHCSWYVLMHVCEEVLASIKGIFPKVEIKKQRKKEKRQKIKEPLRHSGRDIQEVKGM